MWTVPLIFYEVLQWFILTVCIIYIALSELFLSSLLPLFFHHLILRETKRTNCYRVLSTDKRITLLTHFLRFPTLPHGTIRTYLISIVSVLFSPFARERKNLKDPVDNASGNSLRIYATFAVVGHQGLAKGIEELLSDHPVLLVAFVFPRNDGGIHTGHV